MFDELKQLVYEANISLSKSGLVISTWGNVSGRDNSKKYMAIKPSGIEYSKLTPEDIVIIDIISGEIIDGSLKPSSDTPTHLEIYRNFPEIGGIVHTHSIYAVSFAQSGKPILPLGTTHADYFYGPIPCTRSLSKNEVEKNYELNTGKVIIECLNKNNIDILAVPGILVKNHGPFTWGENPLDAVNNALYLETVAKMSVFTLLLNPNSNMPQYILDKHYHRKHGPTAYYGQN